jgi:hypothetical protein
MDRRGGDVIPIQPLAAHIKRKYPEYFERRIFMAKTKQKIHAPAGIRNKLMAATSMLLVSSILMVTSTYAWFTLSTAPEIAGITTSVGANGNLEIALLNTETNADTSKISSAVGSSMAATTAAASNITWGNIVDLSTASDGTDTYGLSKIQLMPSRLNATSSGSLGGTILQVPVYGTDGRVSSLSSSTISGTYSTTDSGFDVDTAGTARGVRAIGTMSSLSDDQRNYVSALAAATSSRTNATSGTQSALNNPGLVNLLNKYVSAKTTSEDAVSALTFTQDEVDQLKTLVTALTSANESAGNAIKQYAVAYTVSKSGDSAKYAALQALSASATPSDYLSTAGLSGSAAANSYSANVTALGTAQTKLDALKDSETYTWAQVKEAVQPMIDTSKVSYSTENGIQVTLAQGSGVFTNLSDMLGDCSANVTLNISGLRLTVAIVPDSVGGSPISANQSAYLLAMQQTVTSAGAPDGDGSASVTTLSDVYGYALDLAVRTNASGSSLKLQTTPQQRIYSTSTNEQTMGGGSTMSFTSSVLTADQMTDLMGAIRVVFVNASNAIVGVAALDDMTTQTVNAEGDTAAHISATGSLKLVDYTITDTGAMNISTTTSTGTEGTEGYKTSTTVNFKSSDVLMELTQNEITKLTAIVYIDGDYVENGDVAATGTSSMTGSMNLQFSSTAELNPMNYTALSTGASNAETITNGNGNGTGTDSSTTDSNPSSNPAADEGSVTEETTTPASGTGNPQDNSEQEEGQVVQDT